MKVRIEDIEALSSPPARNIRLYLRSHGWTVVDDGSSRLILSPQVWELTTADGTYEVIAPSSKDARDYPNLVAELIRTLSIVEERSEVEIIRDLNLLSFDIQYVRVEHGGVAGTAPLKEAASAFSAAYNMVSSAASSLEDPRLVLPIRRPAEVGRVLSRVLAGPTSEGSFVLSIWVPIPPRLTQEEDQVLFDLPGEQPVARQVTLRVNEAVGATRTAARLVHDGGAGLDAFISRKDQGVSANLCEALVAFSGDNQDNPFDIRFSWAMDRPVANVRSVISFPPELMDIMSQAAKELRNILPDQQVTIRGNVVRLSRDGDVGSGEITVAGYSLDEPDRLRRVTVSLSEPDYQIAYDAHGSFDEVILSGELVQRGTRTHLLNARDLTVIQETKP